MYVTCRFDLCLRMNELEETIKELNCKILTEQIKLESFLTKEEIVEFIYKSLKCVSRNLQRLLKEICRRSK